MPIPEMFACSIIREGAVVASCLLPAVERERYAKEAAERYASSGVWTGGQRNPATKKPKSPTGSKSSADGRWITLNGDSGDDGDGGTRIRIDDEGNITAGPKALKHAGITHLSHFARKKSKKGGKAGAKKATKKPEAAKPSKPEGVSNAELVQAATAAAARQESAAGAKALGALTKPVDKPKKNPSDNLIPFLPLDKDPPEESAAATDATPREKPATDLSHWRAALAKLEPAQRKSLLQRFSDWWASLMKEPDTTEYEPGFLGALQRVAAKTFHSKDAAERERYQKDPGAVLRYAQTEIERYAKGDPPQAEELTGKLRLSSSGWLLLDVPDHLAVGAWRALDNPRAQLPFRDGKLNTHISVMRPEEIEQLGGPSAIKDVVGQEFSYQLGEVKTVEPDGWDAMERVWFVECNSPALEDMREGLGLSRLPKDGKHRFHITFAVQPTAGNEKYARSFEPERYAERWITLNGDSGEDGNGGTPVKIDDDGAIVAGPDGLAEKGITHLEHFGGKKPTAEKPAKKEPKPKGSRKKADVTKSATKYDDKVGNNTSVHDTPYANGLVEKLNAYERAWIEEETKNPKASEADLHFAGMQASGLTGDGLATARGYAGKRVSSRPGIYSPAYPSQADWSGKNAPNPKQASDDAAQRILTEAGVPPAKPSKAASRVKGAVSTQARVDGDHVHKKTGKLPHQLTPSEFFQAVDPSGSRFEVGYQDDEKHLEWVRSGIVHDPDSIPTETLQEYAGNDASIANELAHRQQQQPKAKQPLHADPEVNAAAPTGDAFHSTVGEIAKGLQGGAETSPNGRGERFGANKVFIGAAWKAFHRKHPEATREQFNRELLNAHNAGKLKLTRADLIADMHPHDVEESEVSAANVPGGYHFIDTRGWSKAPREMEGPAPQRSGSEAAMRAAGMWRPEHKSKSVGDKLDDLQNHDVKTFDHLMSDPAAREAGITNNEFIRTLKAEHANLTRQKAEAEADGDALTPGQRQAWDASMQHLLARGQSAVKALRGLKQEAAAKFYETHLPALVKEAGEDLFGADKQRNAAEGQSVRYSMFDSIQARLRGAT